jgi:hypothetical protein
VRRTKRFQLERAQSLLDVVESSLDPHLQNEQRSSEFV